MTYLAQTGSANPLAPNLTEFIIGLIAFFIVFGALAKVLLPRIQKTLEERTDAIEGGLERAKETQDEATHLLEQYRAQPAVARPEASLLRERARGPGAHINEEHRAEGEPTSHPPLIPTLNQLHTTRHPSR